MNANQPKKREEPLHKKKGQESIVLSGTAGGFLSESKKVIYFFCRTRDSGGGTGGTRVQGESGMRLVKQSHKIISG